MAASDPHQRSDRPPLEGLDCRTPAAVRERLEEEVSRAERHGTGLSCLLVVIDNLEEMAREHGDELREQMIGYVARALRRELRRYDRVGPVAEHDLVIILPGADSPRAEIVARRALQRLHTIKVEAGGARRPLEISVGLAAWRTDASAESLLAHARAALRSVGAENGYHAPAGPPAHARQPTEPASPSSSFAIPPALGRAGGP